MQRWKAHYKDILHDTDIEILNTEGDYSTDPLSFTLDGITFQGTGLGDFRLADPERQKEAGRKFALLKWGGHHSKYHVTSPYRYDLQRYALEAEIPVSVFRKRDGQTVGGRILLAFRYERPDMSKSHSIVLCDDERVYRDEAVVSEFSLYVDGKCYKSRKMTLWFEEALKDISAQMKDSYYMKCCFTCQYSDYSPYGSDDYGIMLCYCRHKDACLKVNGKDDFFAFLEGKDFDGRQETYLCSRYSPRDRAAGYRGFVEGVADQGRGGKGTAIQGRQ